MPSIESTSKANLVLTLLLTGCIAATLGSFAVALMCWGGCDNIFNTTYLLASILGTITYIGYLFSQKAVLQTKLEIPILPTFLLIILLIPAGYMILSKVFGL